MLTRDERAIDERMSRAKRGYVLGGARGQAQALPALHGAATTVGMLAAAHARARQAEQEATHGR